MPEAPASTAHSETAGQTETSNDNFTAPGQERLGWDPDMTLEQQEKRLVEFLEERFPDQVDFRQEFPIEAAIRLLTGLHAHRANRADASRCSAEFCNKPDGHRDGHGWVHFG
jgi:hypothetical protein